jgi:predicted nucleotidyltransferase
MDRDRLRAALLAELPDIQAAYLFGSHAAGRARAGSDVDVAVLRGQPMAPGEANRLAEDLSLVLAADVHVVDLVAASDVLRAQVIGHGELLLDQDVKARDSFEALALAAYARLNEERRAILERVTREGRVYG